MDFDTKEPLIYIHMGLHEAARDSHPHDSFSQSHWITSKWTSTQSGYWFAPTWSFTKSGYRFTPTHGLRKAAIDALDSHPRDHWIIYTGSFTHSGHWCTWHGFCTMRLLIHIYRLFLTQAASCLHLFVLHKAAIDLYPHCWTCWDPKLEMLLAWSNRRGRKRGIEERNEEMERGKKVERGRGEGRIRKEKEGRKGGSLGLTVTGF